MPWGYHVGGHAEPSTTTHARSPSVTIRKPERDIQNLNQTDLQTRAPLGAAFPLGGAKRETERERERESNLGKCILAVITSGFKREATGSNRKEVKRRKKKERRRLGGGGEGGHNSRRERPAFPTQIAKLRGSIGVFILLLFFGAFERNSFGLDPHTRENVTLQHSTACFPTPTSGINGGGGARLWHSGTALNSM